MPVYDYRCTDPACAAWQRAYRSVSSREDAPACLTCGGPSQKGLRGLLSGQKPSPMKDVPERAEVEAEPGLRCPETGRRYRLVDITCTDEACAHTDETAHVWLGDDGEPAEAPPACEKCGSETRYESVLNAISRFSEVFPYYDMGMGCWLYSKRHRRDEMKRRGLVEADQMDHTIEQRLRAEDDEDRRVFADYRELQEMYETHPDFRGVYAQMKAEGRALPELDR